VRTGNTVDCRIDDGTQRTRGLSLACTWNGGLLLTGCRIAGLWVGVGSSGFRRSGSHRVEEGRDLHRHGGSIRVPEKCEDHGASRCGVSTCRLRGSSRRRVLCLCLVYVGSWPSADVGDSLVINNEDAAGGSPPPGALAHGGVGAVRTRTVWRFRIREWKRVRRNEMFDKGDVAMAAVAEDARILDRGGFLQMRTFPPPAGRRGGGEGLRGAPDDEDASA
jgi:hypothetical protein